MKLEHDKLLSNFAFKCNLRHYNEGVLLAARQDREVTTLEDLMQGAERTKNGVGVVGRCRLTPGFGS